MRLFRTCAPAAVLVAALLAFVSAAPDAVAAPASPVIVDSGDDPTAWTAIASPSATARIVSRREESSPSGSSSTGNVSASGQGGAAASEKDGAAASEKGGAVGLAFDLGRGRSHVIARRTLSLDLPADYMFVFTLESDAEPNTVEIKFISGENVWWRRLPDYEFPREWKDLRVSKSRIAFAWGPAAGGMPVRLDAIEIAVAAGKGGKGELWIDQIRLEPRDGNVARKAPVATVSSNVEAAPALLDGDPATAWRSREGEAAPAVTLDFHQALEQGGLEIEYNGDDFATDYVVEASSDLAKWEEVRRYTRSDGGLDPVYMPDVYARYVRLRFAPAPGRTVAIREVRPQPFEFSASPNGFFTGIAGRSAPGLYPRYFTGQQSYWTVVGVPGDTHEALVNEEGSVEVDAGAFTLEPFLFKDGALRTWKDAVTTASLADGDLPMPSVLRRDGDVSLKITAFAAGEPGAATLYVRYALTTVGAASKLRLFVAVRPFQVLPPWQALNRIGGVTPIARIARDGSTVRVDDRRLIALTQPDAFGAAAFEQGDITSHLSRNVVPSSSSVNDPFAHASAALAWDLDLVPGETSVVWVAQPWSESSSVVGAPTVGASAARETAAQTTHLSLDALLARTRADWKSRVERVAIDLPPAVADWTASLRSNLAYILINADGAAIQPGSRTYERSWIRDGAMTSGALLELGLDREVKDFLRWYAGYVGKDGWVPCCVDARGADPVPEHDSFGEFIWAVAEVWRFTRDEAFVREMWPHVKAIAGCMSRLRATRMTPEYADEPRGAYFGLLPESISHEGYSARPVHSYWDQAFALRGYMDAAMLAGVVGDDGTAAKLAGERDSFEKTLRESIRLTTEQHRLDVVPASVELGDFDPTSTAVSFLLGIEDVYARDALGRSFDKYVGDLRARRGRTTAGVGYTAYELRTATALVLTGRKAEAIELLETLVADQRPAAWNQWPEITWLSPPEPSFLGDLPHTWIGSTFVHAVRTLLVTEREEVVPGKGRVESLLVGAGIPLAWLDGGHFVRGRSLPTWFGPLSLAMRREPPPPDRDSDELRVVVQLEAGSSPSQPGEGAAAARTFAIPDGGIRLAAPFGAEVSVATVDGVAESVEDGTVRVPRLPATVIFQYKPRLENPR